MISYFTLQVDRLIHAQLYNIMNWSSGNYWFTELLSSSKCWHCITQCEKKSCSSPPQTSSGEVQQLSVGKASRSQRQPSIFQNSNFKSMNFITGNNFVIHSFEKAPAKCSNPNNHWLPVVLSRINVCNKKQWDNSTNTFPSDNCFSLKWGRSISYLFPILSCSKNICDQGSRLNKDSFCFIKAILECNYSHFLLSCHC